jgi:hypothetical protein
VILVTAVMAAGCGEPGEITGGEVALAADEDSAAFLDRMSSQKTVTENDAARGLLMLTDGEDTAGTFEQRITALQANNIVSDCWDHNADRAVTRGRLAYMLYQATDMPGGVILTVAGPSQRYCLRELQYRGVMGKGAMFVPVTGLEFVSALNRADTYKQTGQVPDQAGSISEN